MSQERRRYSRCPGCVIDGFPVRSVAHQLIALHDHPLVEVVAAVFFQPLIFETPGRIWNGRQIAFRGRLLLIHSHNQLLPLRKIQGLQRPQNPILENDMYLALHASL